MIPPVPKNTHLENAASDSVSRTRLVKAMFIMGLGLGTTGLAQTQEPSNYFQIRYFAPGPLQDWQFTAGFALDASLESPFDGGNFSLNLSNTSLSRQTLALEVTADTAFGQLEVKREPGAELGGYKWGFTAVGSYLFPKPSEGIAPVTDLTVTYVFETDSSTESYYSVNAANLSLRGQLYPGWGWNLGYGLTATGVTGSDNLTQSLQARVNGKIDPVTLNLGFSSRFQNGGPRYDTNLEASLPVTDLETITAQTSFGIAMNVEPDSRFSDEERVSVSSQRFEPITLGAYLGRNNSSALLWGLNAEYPLDKTWTLSSDYGGTAGESPTHEFSIQGNYRESQYSAGLQGRTSIDYDPSRELWFATAGFRVNGTFKVSPWNIGARASLDLKPNSNAAVGGLKTTGSLSGTLAWAQDEWSANLELGFNWQNSFSGLASAQVLYRFDANLALNVSGLYRRTLTPTISDEFSLGLGLRWNF
jgi:hypothetical protein